MCLRHPKEFRVRGKYAYKVLKKVGNQLFLTCQGNRNKPIKKRVWLDEKDFRPTGLHRLLLFFEHSREGYTAGWHLFMSKKDALSYAKSYKITHCFKIEFKDIRAKGVQKKFWAPFQGLHHCIVVGKMKIIEEVKG